MREEDAARGELARITAEYERLAFAPIEDGLVKPADKLRALAEYARLVRMREEGPALTVLYDYGGGDFAADEAQRVPPRTPEEGSDDA